MIASNACCSESHDLHTNSHNVNRTAQASGKGMHRLACSNACSSPLAQWNDKSATYPIRTGISRLRMNKCLEDARPRRQRRPEDATYLTSAGWRTRAVGCASHWGGDQGSTRVLGWAAMLTSTPYMLDVWRLAVGGWCYLSSILALKDEPQRLWSAICSGESTC
jgi:hypothetical protein